MVRARLELRTENISWSDWMCRIGDGGGKGLTTESTEEQKETRGKLG